MRVALILVIFLFPAAGIAHGQAFNAIGGKPVTLRSAYVTNPDCTSAGEVVIRVVEGPRNGRVAIARTGVFPNFPASNPRSACNRRRVPGTVASYVAQRGYTGDDSVTLEFIYPTGHYRRGSFNIIVR